ncbi:MAG: hypothetical protein IJM43_06300 [Bacteroidaceae bacterium]|nr:hypothetical protein [Bacteroidaceae bacterium]
MNKNEITEHIFLDKLAGIIISMVDEEKYGFRAVIIREGHFNGKVFSKDTMFNQYATDFWRFMLNLAGNIESEKFMARWMEIGKHLCKTGESGDLELINKNHGKKSNSDN